MNPDHYDFFRVEPDGPVDAAIRTWSEQRYAARQADPSPSPRGTPAAPWRPPAPAGSPGSSTTRCSTTNPLTGRTGP
jgi:hypothetical protein